MLQRRHLLTAAGAGTIAACATPPTGQAAEPRAARQALDEAAARPVLRRDRLPDPIIIEDVRLLRTGDIFFVEVRSTDGETGIALTNVRFMKSVWPLFLNRVAPYFKGEDARD
ncbi:MAG: hypothetical protein MI723_03385, partial [Caulobacterales bacterium]|nr:hypothetical protein [Caulobacterales bacterium]